MKVIDFELKGNVIKLYCGSDNCEDYHGDDWDDAPYEHNAGQVYSSYVAKVYTIAIPFNYDVFEPASDWHYEGNSPFCKEDMKSRNCPCIVVAPEDWWNNCYTSLIGADKKEVIKIYFGDSIEKLLNNLKNIGAKLL